jgi:ribosome modulation factor
MMQLAPLVLGAQLLLVADRPPQLDTEPACRAVERSGVNGRSREVCMNEENTARTALDGKWKDFTATQQAHCTGLVRMGGPPSYVELLTCLEMAEQAQKIPPGGRLRDTTGAAAKEP